jgi:lysophospholipase L1-like esterase
MSRFKYVLKVLVVNGLVLAALLIVIELVFGGWINEQHLNRLNILKDCHLKYDVSHLYHDANPTIRYSRDKYGLRGDFGTPDRIDILTVGGSTTDQRYIRDGETWQDVLQQRFRDAGVAVALANAGVDGQSTYGHIKDFEWWFPNIPGLRPAYVLFYIGLNDFYKEPGYAFDALNDQSAGFKNEIKTKSVLYHVARTAKGAIQAMAVKKISHRGIDFAAVVYTDHALQSDYAFMDTRLAEYGTRVQALAQMTRKLGATPIFVTQPSRRYRVRAGGVDGENQVESYDGHDFNGVDFYYMMRRLDGVTRSVSEKDHALFVDLAANTEWEDADFYDFAHMTPRGAKKVGDALYEALKSAVSIPARESAAK